LVAGRLREYTPVGDGRTKEKDKKKNGCRSGKFRQMRVVSFSRKILVGVWGGIREIKIKSYLETPKRIQEGKPSGGGERAKDVICGKKRDEKKDSERTLEGRR